MIIKQLKNLIGCMVFAVLFVFVGIPLALFILGFILAALGVI